MRGTRRERLRAGHAVLNGKVVGAFATAVVLHALWDTFNLLRGATFVNSLSLELLSLLVAVVSLTLLIKRVKEASRAPVAKGDEADSKKPEITRLR
jgi:protease PrsW